MKTAQKNLLSCCLFSLLICSCSTAGLGNVTQTRANYNKALDTSENEQFLLNVVRLHYAESPYFVAVDSITAATSLTTGVRGDIGVNSPWSAINAVQWGISPQMAFSQTPTVTYSPINGAKFATSMLAPLSLDQIYLLLQSGYNIKEVMKLTLERIGKLDNGAAASHIGINKLPDSSKFDNFIDTLSNLTEANQVLVELTEYESTPAIFIYSTNPEAAATLASGLGLSKPYSKLVFASVLSIDKSQPENIISLHNRSFFNVINFLSKNVDNPIAAESANYNATLANPNLNWDSYTHSMLHVLVSKSEPSCAVAKIEYGGNWYYISEDDDLSKSTLILMKLIFSLKMSGVKANLPLITIPIIN